VKTRGVVWARDRCCWGLWQGVDDYGAIHWGGADWGSTRGCSRLSDPRGGLERPFRQAAAGQAALAILFFVVTIALVRAIIEGGALGHDESAYALKARSWLIGTPDTGWQLHRAPALSILGLRDRVHRGRDAEQAHRSGTRRPGSWRSCSRWTAAWRRLERGRGGCNSGSRALVSSPRE